MQLLKYNNWILSVSIKNDIVQFTLSDGWKSVWPIQYDNANIAYDYPEDVPKGLLAIIEKRKYKIQSKINTLKSSNH